MLIKVTLLFLLAIVLVAMIGRALFPGALRRGTARRDVGKPGTCPRCGRCLIGKNGCDCTAGRKA